MPAYLTPGRVAAPVPETLPAAPSAAPVSGGGFWSAALPSLIGAGVTGIGALVGGGEGAARAAAGFGTGAMGEYDRRRNIELAQEQERTRNMRQIEEEQRRERREQDVETRAESRWKEHLGATSAAQAEREQRNKIEAPPEMGLPPGTMIEQDDLVRYKVAEKQAEASGQRQEKGAQSTFERQAELQRRGLEQQLEMMKQRESESRGREMRASQQQWNRGLMDARESALREGVTPDAAEAAYRRRFSEPGEAAAAEHGFGEGSSGVPTPPPQVGATPSATLGEPTPQPSAGAPPPCPPPGVLQRSKVTGAYRCLR